MDKRSLKLSLKEAIELYKNGDDSMKALLLTSFTEDELTCPVKPKSWNDLELIKGSWVSSESEVYYADTPLSDEHMNVFPTKKQAEASIALAQLLQLMQHKYWNGDWIPDWSDGRENKYVIVNINGFFTVENMVLYSRVLAFKTIEKGKEFVESYPELLEQAKPLL